MPHFNSTATGPGVAGHVNPNPPPRTPTFSSLYRRATGKKEEPPKVETMEWFIPKYELEWVKLKDWLDDKFANYNCTFTERFNVKGDMYVVYLPEVLNEEDDFEIAMLKTPRSTT